MTYQVIFTKDPNSDVNVMYSGEVNLYEFIGLLEIEKEKLKHKVKVSDKVGLKP